MRACLLTVLIALTMVSYSSCKHTASSSGQGNQSATADSRRNYDQMILIKGGKFMMGTDAGMPYESPEHEVTVKSFFIDRHEVTVAEFARFVAATGYQTDAEKFGWSGAFNLKTREWEKTKGADWRHPEGPDSKAVDNEPVCQVSWTDAAAYAKWAGKRLPTEAEWEYAARAGGATAYVLSDDPRELDRYAWGAQNSGRMTHPVGQKPANKFGLHDMIGNVYELTLDCYRDNHVGAPTDGSAVMGANCPHVVKGGSHYSGPENLRPSDRGRVPAEVYDSTLGFRIARALP